MIESIASLQPVIPTKIFHFQLVALEHDRSGMLDQNAMCFAIDPKKQG